MFGWGHQMRKDFGMVTKLNCTHCNNDEYWHLLKSTNWFTLFFIPVIPYSSEKFLICPVCQYGITLDDKKFEELKPIAETNQLLIEGKITGVEYANRIRAINGGTVDQTQAIENTEIKEASICCNECGKEINTSANFCKHCGNKLS